MLVALLLTLTSSTTGLIPQVAVVHDGALEDARVVANHMNASGKVLATLREAPLTASCARTTACVDRPSADALVSVSRAPAPSQSMLRIDLVDKAGATLTSEIVSVADPALLDATLAPALDRIALAAVRATTAPTTSSAPPPDANTGNAWMPWVLGTGAVCGGLCVLATGGLVAYAMLVSAREAGNAAQSSCNDACTTACNAPFDALGKSCDAFSSVGDSCSGIGDSCSGAGDGLGSACDGIGNIGSCAVMPALALSAQETGDPRPITPQSTSPPGAMRY